MKEETTAITTSKIGAPVKYNPSYCEKIQLARCEGAPIVVACSTLGIAPDTYYRWKKEYPEFKEATELAEGLCTRWWFEVGKQGMLKEREIQPQLYNQLMDRTFGSVKTNDASKTEINIGNMNVLQNLSQEDLQKKIASKLAALGLAHQPSTEENNE